MMSDSHVLDNGVIVGCRRNDLMLEVFLIMVNK
jgi:hypothetical protein